MGFVQNTKIELDRPRPYQVRELGGRYAYAAPFGSFEGCPRRKCTSFPSSAAGSAFLVAAPFFVLYPRRRIVALAFLATGIAWGSFIGFARMVPGLHWLTDVVWSAAFVFAVAATLAHVQVRWAARAP